MENVPFAWCRARNQTSANLRVRVFMDDTVWISQMNLKPGSIPQAFPYQGSKRKLAPAIVECVPPDTDRLIEPFAGSAAISVATAWANRARRFWINDAHEALVALWRRIIHDPDGLSQDYHRIWDEQHGRDRRTQNVSGRRLRRDHKDAKSTRVSSRS